MTGGTGKVYSRRREFVRYFYFFIFLNAFFRAALQHMEVPRLTVELELQLPGYATATAMQDPSCVSALQHSSQQCRILSFFVFFVFCLFAISWAAPAAYGGSQARGLIGAAAAGLRQSHSNMGSELSRQPTPQLTATLDP